MNFENEEMDFYKMKSDISILNHKKEEYTSRIQSSESVFTNWTDVKQECQSILELIKEIKDSQELLDSYKCLPPDLNLAKMELERMERERNRLINSIK